MKAGQIIQNYVLERQIGEGGMGEVWLAKHQLLDRKVAIKSLHQQYARNESLRVRFKNEATSLSRLQHPNIVNLYDYIEDEEGFYLVLEFVNGMDLSDYIQERSGPLPEPKLIPLFLQILEAFAYAHGKMVVHRDIKPSNFLITAKDQIKILDFGIAKLLDSQLGHTKTGTRMGTVFYMSPEQVNGKSVDHRSDIYSLGVTLFQMATGVIPYGAEDTEFQIYNQIVNDPLPPMANFYPGVAPYLDAIVKKATAKNLQDRYQSVEEMIVALQAKAGTLRNPPPIAPPIPRPPLSNSGNSPSDKTRFAEFILEAAAFSSDGLESDSPAEPRKRKKTLLLVATSLLMLAVVAIALWWYSGDKVDDRLYVIASGLFIRTQPNSEGERMDKLPYGTPVEIKEEVNSAWIEMEHQGRKGFLARRYLVGAQEFLELDLLGSNQEAKLDLLAGSYHKTGLQEYFQKSKYNIDLPEEEYEEKYGTEKSSKDIWLVDGLSSEKQFNNGIPYLYFEKPKKKYKKKELENSAFIIQNKGDSQKRRLVIFRYLSDGSSLDITSMDLEDYPGYSIQAVALEDLGPYICQTYSDQYAIRRDLQTGKQGVLLGKNTLEGPVHLLTWKSLGKPNFYTLTRGKKY